MLAVFLKCSFFSRLRLKLVRYKAEQKLSSGQTNKRRGMGRGEKKECDFKPPAFNLVWFLERHLNSSSLVWPALDVCVMPMSTSNMWNNRSFIDTAAMN